MELQKFFILQILNSILIILNNNSPFLPPPHCWVITILFFISINLFTLDTSYEWSHTGFILLWLVFSTYHNVLKVNPCCNMWQQDFFAFCFNGSKPYDAYLWRGEGDIPNRGIRRYKVPKAYLACLTCTKSKGWSGRKCG